MIQKSKFKKVLQAAKERMTTRWANGYWLEVRDPSGQRTKATANGFTEAYSMAKNGQIGPNDVCYTCMEGAIAVEAAQLGLSFEEAEEIRRRTVSLLGVSIPSFNDSFAKERGAAPKSILKACDLAAEAYENDSTEPLVDKHRFLNRC